VTTRRKQIEVSRSTSKAPGGLARAVTLIVLWDSRRARNRQHRWIAIDSGA
jgi:hypothetical protein